MKRVLTIAFVLAWGAPAHAGLFLKAYTIDPGYSAASRAAAVPAGCTTGDLMVGVAFSNQTANLISDPAGWSRQTSVTNAGATQMTISTRAFQAGDTSFTWTITGAQNVDPLILCVSDSGGATVALDQVVTGTGASATTGTLPAITPVSGTDGYDLLLDVWQQASSAATWTLPDYGAQINMLRSTSGFYIGASAAQGGVAADTPTMTTNATAVWGMARISLKVTSKSTLRMTMRAVQEAHNGASASTAFTIPSNTKTNDLIVVVLGNSSGNTISSVTGLTFTQVATFNSAHGALYIRTATNTDAGTTCTVNWSTTGNNAVAMMVVTPIDGGTVSVDTESLAAVASSTTCTTGTLTTGASNELVLSGCQQSNGALPSGTANALPNGTSDLLGDFPGKDDNTNVFTTELGVASSGTLTSAKTYTTSGATVWNSWQVALKTGGVSAPGIILGN